MFIAVIIIMAIVVILSFTAGAYFTIEGELKLEFNKKISPWE